MAATVMVSGALMVPGSITRVAPHIRHAIETSIMPANFFSLPADAPARFSTNNGSQPKRGIPQPPPSPMARSDFDFEIQRKVNNLRAQFHDLAAVVVCPTHWRDLYKYFDAYDIWLEGAAFLYFVLNKMSNENFEKRNSLERQEIKELCEAEIYKWADEWVESNFHRIEQLPLSKNLLEVFNQNEAQDVATLRPYQVAILQTALQYSHDVSKTKMRKKRETDLEATRKQQIQPAMQLRSSYQQQLMPPHAQMGTRAYPFPVPIEAVSPVQPFSHFMDSQRQLAGGSLMPRPVSNNDQWQTGRARGYSNETHRNSRGQHQHRNNMGHFADRRMSFNNPNGQMKVADTPIYVHNPVRGRSDQQPRIFSDPLTGRTGVSNDARQWQSSSNKENQRPPIATPQRLPIAKCDAPFANHPMARVSSNSSTFYYSPEVMETFEKDPQEYRDYYKSRTLYVSNGIQDDFINHHLREIFEKHGKVVAISYLYQGGGGGGVFVMFADESSVQRALIETHITKNSRELIVRLPNNDSDKRDRSGSQSSQYSYTSHRRGTAARNSNSSTQRPWTGDRYYIPSSTSPEDRPRSPLTAGFQSQLIPPPSFNINYHNSPEGVGQPMPLATINNSSNAIQKGVMGSAEKHQRANKENTPMGSRNVSRNASRNATPSATPRQISANQSGSRRGKGNKNGGSKQNTSTRPTPAVTPVKPRSTTILISELPLDQSVSQALYTVSPSIQKDGNDNKLRDMILTELSTDVKQSQPAQEQSISSAASTKADRDGHQERTKYTKKYKSKPKKSHRGPDRGAMTGADVPDRGAVIGADVDISKSTGTSFSQSSLNNLSSTTSDTSLSTPDDKSSKLDIEATQYSPNLREMQIPKPDSIPDHLNLDVPKTSSASVLAKPASSKGKRQRKTSHAKKQSTTSSGSGSSVRKADTNGKLAATPTIEDAETTDANIVGPEIPTEKNPDTAEVKVDCNPQVSIDKKAESTVTPGILDNPNEWPALAPPKAIGIDSEPPAVVPAVRPSKERKASAKVVPVIPLNMERSSRRHSSLNTDAWPIVKKCSTK